MKHVFFFIVLFLAQTVLAQNEIRVLVKSAESHQPLVGANVYFDSLQIGASTNAQGLAEIKHIPNGRHVLVTSYVGYRTTRLLLNFPLPEKQRKILTVLLEPAPFRSEQIVVTSTRNNSIVAKTPVRIEVLGKEEVNEEIGIQPGNISKFLGESSSIITQQTSLISGAVRFRLQGLPARYTKLLKDGFPDFSDLGSGLSPLQIPPLDLQQIEITRGSYSTLFANGAVAGIINLISRQPTAKPHLDLLLNRTNRQGTDVSSFYSAKYGKVGLTFLTSQSLQSAVDVDGDGFSDIPQFRQATINPRLFYYFNNKTKLMVGLNSFFENRTGGDMQVLRQGGDSLHLYKETYATKRLGLDVRFRKEFADGSAATFKTSYQNFGQNVTFPLAYFNGKQNYTFGEATYFVPAGKHKWVGGISFVRNTFHQSKQTAQRLYDSSLTTTGLFAQDDWSFAPGLTFHGGLRWDYQWKNTSFFLPHAALLFDACKNVKLRLSGGFGYSVPVLNEVAPEKDYYAYHIAPTATLQAERSRDLSFDVTYHYWNGALALNLNQAFYVTQVHNAQFVYPSQDDTPIYFFSAPITAQGAETHLVVNVDELEIFLDYNYVNTRRTISGQSEAIPFTPKHKVNFTVTYEKEGNWRSGFEGFYTGSQFLRDGKQTKPYLIFGFMIEKKFKKFSLIFNIENLLDERQSKHEQMVEPPRTQPTFKDIYMPVEGRVINLALWFKL